MKIILLDPGHGIHKGVGKGKADPGAVAFNKTEAEYAVIVAEKAANILEKTFGFRVYMTRGDFARAIHPRDYNPLSKRGEALSWRRELAAQLHADAFVSIHFNASVLSSVSGSEVLVKPNAPLMSQRFAKAINASLVGSLAHYDAVKLIAGYTVKNRGVKKQSLGVLPTGIPACLVECEFITNPVVNALLEGDVFIWTLAHGIASGIYNYMGANHD